MNPSWIVKYLVWLFEATRMICHRRQPLRIIISSYEFWKSESNWHLPGKRDENRNHFWTISGANRFSYECPVWCVSFPKEDCGWLIKPSIFHFQFPFSYRWTCSSNFPSGAWSYINFQFGHVFSEGKSYLAGRTTRVILERAYVPPKAANVKLETPIRKRFCGNFLHPFLHNWVSIWKIKNQIFKKKTAIIRL